MTPDTAPTPTAALVEQLAEAAQFLEHCRGSEPYELFMAHARACVDAGVALLASAQREAELTEFVRQWKEVAEDNERAYEAERAALREALTNLRDWFAYGQHEHVGQFTRATPRCSPSAWKEIKRRVDAALAATAAPSTTKEG